MPSILDAYVFLLIATGPASAKMASYTYGIPVSVVGTTEFRIHMSRSNLSISYVFHILTEKYKISIVEKKLDLWLETFS